jgi:acyl carrier protein
MAEPVEHQLDIDRWLAEVCHDLKLPFHSLDDDIFDIGATSLTVMRLTERIERHFGAPLDPEDILESSTLRGIAQTILTKTAEAAVSESSA